MIILLALIQTALAAPINMDAKNAKVMFVEPKNNATVKSPFKVKMGIANTALRPAGEDINDHKTGHHHLLIDTKPIPSGEAVPTDATHMHFGKAQAETEVTLAPGDHTLTLQFADGAHRSYGEALSSTITVHVK